MQFIWRRVLPVDNYKWSIKICWAVNLKLVREGISLKSVAVTFKEQDVEANLITFWVFNLTCIFDCNFLAENTKQWLLIGWNILSKDWLPEALLRLEYVFQTRILKWILSSPSSRRWSCYCPACASCSYSSLRYSTFNRLNKFISTDSQFCSW